VILGALFYYFTSPKSSSVLHIYGDEKFLAAFDPNTNKHSERMIYMMMISPQVPMEEKFKGLATLVSSENETSFVVQINPNLGLADKTALTPEIYLENLRQKLKELKAADLLNSSEWADLAEIEKFLKGHPNRGTQVIGSKIIRFEFDSPKKNFRNFTKRIRTGYYEPTSHFSEASPVGVWTPIENSKSILKMKLNPSFQNAGRYNEVHIHRLPLKELAQLTAQENSLIISDSAIQIPKQFSIKASSSRQGIFVQLRCDRPFFSKVENRKNFWKLFAKQIKLQRVSSGLSIYDLNLNLPENSVQFAEATNGFGVLYDETFQGQDEIYLRQLMSSIASDLKSKLEIQRSNQKISVQNIVESKDNSDVIFIKRDFINVLSKNQLWGFFCSDVLGAFFGSRKTFCSSDFETLSSADKTVEEMNSDLCSQRVGSTRSFIWGTSDISAPKNLAQATFALHTSVSSLGHY
jgi:hypothetical protein